MPWCSVFTCNHYLVKAERDRYRCASIQKTPCNYRFIQTKTHTHAHTDRNILSVWVPSQDFIWNSFPNTSQQAIWTGVWLRRGKKNRLQREIRKRKRRGNDSMIQWLTDAWANASSMMFQFTSSLPKRLRTHSPSPLLYKGISPQTQLSQRWSVDRSDERRKWR